MEKKFHKILKNEKSFNSMNTAALIKRKVGKKQDNKPRLEQFISMLPSNNVHIRYYFKDYTCLH